MLLAALLALHASCVRDARAQLAAPDRPRVAVVTGCNRGIGYSTVRQLCRTFEGSIFYTTRSVVRGRSALKRLNMEGCFPSFFQLHIGQSRSREEFVHYLELHHGGVNVLINNAGVRPLLNQTDGANLFRAKNTLYINYFSTVGLTQMLFSLMRPHGRVVNLSGSCGHVTDLPGCSVRALLLKENLGVRDLTQLMDRYRESLDEGTAVSGGWGDDPYCVSKVAVTAFTYALQRKFDINRPGEDVVVNCYNPGDVNSKINYYVGSVAPDDAAANVIALASLPVNVTSPVGQFVWHDMSIVDWNGSKPIY